MAIAAEVLIEFNIDLFYAPNINDAHILSQDKWSVYEEFFKKHLDDTIYLGEQEGKHSEVRTTGQELLDACRVTQNPDEIAAFRLLYGERRTNSYLLGNIEEHQDFDFKALEGFQTD